MTRGGFGGKAKRGRKELEMGFIDAMTMGRMNAPHSKKLKEIGK